MIITSSLYLVNSILYTLVLKSFDYLFSINNIFFCCLVFGLFYPFMFIYISYNKLEIKLLDCICAILDYSQLILFYICINNVSIAEYISYRTSSLIFNLILSHLFLISNNEDNEQNNKEYYIKIIGAVIVFSSCIVMLFANGVTNIFYGCLTLLSSFIYSIINFLIEKYPGQSNFIQTKTVSNFLNILTYISYSLYYDSITNFIKINSSFLLWFMMIFMGFSEMMYYLLKYQITVQVNEGSIFTNILDISRRVVTLILGLAVFGEKYEISYYICFSSICIGCIFIQFNKQIYLYFYSIPISHPIVSI